MGTSKHILALICLLFLVSACSSTTMLGSWASPDHAGKIENVYLVCNTKYELTRRILEDSFASDLVNRGIRTFPSYKDLPSNHEFNREEIIKTMAKKGFDSVLFTYVVSQRNETVINPGYVSYDRDGYFAGRGGYFADRGGYFADRGGYFADRGGYFAGRGGYYGGRGGYGNYYSATFLPPTRTDFTIYTVESALYDLQTGEMIWLANLDVVGEMNIEEMVQDYVEVVIKDLNDKGLI